jgi:hypothetical protein
MRKSRLFLIAVCIASLAGHALAGSLGRSVARGATKSIAKRARPLSRSRLFDWKRDRRTPLRKLKQDRLVDRYTSVKSAAAERKTGILPYRHMTARSTRRPLNTATAKQRLGLSTQPTVVERIRISRGTPLHFNKVVGGKPGYGEITAPNRLPGSSIQRVLKLKR